RAQYPLRPAGAGGKTEASRPPYREAAMSVDRRQASTLLEHLLHQRSREEILAQLTPHTEEAPPNVPGGAHVTDEALDRRWQLVPHAAGTRGQLLDSRTLEQREAYRQNVENFLGTLKVPVGLAGPLRVNGLFARGDYYVPLATSEAALVASYSRGSQLITEA